MGLSGDPLAQISWLAWTQLSLSLSDACWQIYECVFQGNDKDF